MYSKLSDLDYFSSSRKRQSMCCCSMCESCFLFKVLRPQISAPPARDVSFSFYVSDLMHLIPRGKDLQVKLQCMRYNALYNDIHRHQSVFSFGCLQTNLKVKVCSTILIVNINIGFLIGSHSLKLDSLITFITKWAKGSF